MKTHTYISAFWFLSVFFKESLHAAESDGLERRNDEGIAKNWMIDGMLEAERRKVLGEIEGSKDWKRKRNVEGKK